MPVILEFTFANMKQNFLSFFWSFFYSASKKTFCEASISVFLDTKLICNWVHLHSVYFCLCEPL